MSEADLPPSVDDAMTLLESVELFSGLPDRDLRRVARIARHASMAPGESVFEEGDPGSGLNLVAQGTVELIRWNGREEEVLAVRRPGEAFGEGALLHDAPRSTSARATEPTRLVVIDRKEFETLLAEDPLAQRIVQTLARAVRGRDVASAAAPARSASGPDLGELSRVIRRGMLPRGAPKIPGFDLAAGTTLETSGRGNTTWDHFAMPDGRVAIMILDVRAEGFPPAHIAALARVALRTASRSAGTADDLLRIANAGLADSHSEGVDQFVECGVLIPSDDGVDWACAGRMPAGVLGRDGTFRPLGSHGPPLGMMEGFRYGVERARMGSGDALLVLSAGSTGLFRGAADLVAQVHGKPAGEVVGTVHRAVRKAQGEDSEEISVAYLRHH